MIEAAARPESVAETTAHGDRHALNGALTRRRQLAMLSDAERATALLERYSELLILPNCDWDRLGVTTVFGLLFGASSRHFARIELATLAGILTTAGVSTAYMIDGEHCVRTVLDLMKQRFGISTPHAITHLKAAHGGEIPVVAYDRFHSKAEHLGPERYLFQWNGRHLRKSLINGLIRFVLDGIQLVDRAGERIDVTSHLLRHAGATVQRQQYGVPLEVLAEAMGHTLTADGQAPEATRYYSQMTEAQKAEIRHDTVLAIMDDAKLAVRVIEPEHEAERLERLMTEADERTREVLERYGGLHPVTFGHCGCGYPGLCVRGTARSFCLGCPFLVRRPEYLDRVDFLLEGYLAAADAHERMGDLAGARERKRLIAELRQLRSEMLLLAEAERQGSWTPRWKQVPPLHAASTG